MHHASVCRAPAAPLSVQSFTPLRKLSAVWDHSSMVLYSAGMVILALLRNLTLVIISISFKPISIITES